MNKDAVIRMAREAGYGKAMADLHAPALERFAAIVAAHEREECAKVCHDKAWEIKEMAMSAETRGKGTRLNDAAIAWYEAHQSIRARGKNA